MEHMPTVSGKILSVDEETKLLQPIDSYVNEIQKKVDALRANGTTRVVELQSSIDAAKSDRVLTKAERDEAINGFKVEMEQAKKVEAQNKGQIDKLVADAENYLKAHYETEYLAPVKVSCAAEREPPRLPIKSSSPSSRRSTRRALPVSPTRPRLKKRSTSIRTSSSTLR